MEGKLKFAIFGTGYWSTLQIPAWYEVGGVELVAVYNRTREKGEKVAQRFNIPRVYSDAEELLRNEDIDFMDITTEIPAHALLVNMAAKHRMPVICQKPMGPDYPTCEAMVNACKEAGIPMFIHENFRWQPTIRAVKDAIIEDRIGKIFRAHIQLGNGGVEAFKYQPFLKTLKHNALTDTGSHIFDLARFYFGEPRSIFCQAFVSREFMAGEDVASAMLRIGDVICTCEISEHIGSRVFIEGIDGTIELKPDNNLYITTKDGTVIRDCSIWPRYSWISAVDERIHGGDSIHSIVLCLRHLLECLKTGREAETSGEDNLKTMKIVYAAIESAEQNKVVIID